MVSVRVSLLIYYVISDFVLNRCNLISNSSEDNTRALNATRNVLEPDGQKIPVKSQPIAQNPPRNQASNEDDYSNFHLSMQIKREHSVQESESAVCLGKRTDGYKASDLFEKIVDPSIYNSREFPLDGSELPLKIFTSCFVYFITNVDSLNSEYSIHLLISHRWVDQRLNYSKLDTNVTVIQGEAWHRDRIWVPNIYFVNEKSAELQREMKENVHVAIFPDGTVIYSYRIKLTLYCQIMVSMFPFDIQTCRLIMRSWSYNASNVEMEWEQDKPLQLSSMLEIPEFYVVTTFVEKKKMGATERTMHAEEEIWTSRLSYSESDYLYVSFRLARHSSHYVIVYYLPSIMLVLVSWVSFWLDSNASPARVTLGASTLLTFITLTRNTDTAIPRVSYITALEIWFFACTAFIFLSLVEFAFVNIIYRRRDEVFLKKPKAKYILKSSISPYSSQRNLPLYPSLSTTNNSPHDTLLVKKKERSASACDLSKLQSLWRLKELSEVQANNLHHISSNRRMSDGTDSNVYLNPNDGCQSIELSVPELKSLNNELKHMKQPLEIHQQGTKVAPQEISQWIDTKSRICFPVAFILFNILYWSIIIPMRWK